MSQEWTYTGLEDFLKKIGVWGRATPDQLKEYKKVYKREYHKHYQRKHRSERPEFTVNFTKAQTKKLRALAQEQNISCPDFIRRLTLEVLGNPVRIQSPITLESRQILSNIYSEIQNMIRNDLGNDVTSISLYGELLERIERMEEVVNREIWS